MYTEHFKYDLSIYLLWLRGGYWNKIPLDGEGGGLLSRHKHALEFDACTLCNIHIFLWRRDRDEFNASCKTKNSSDLFHNQIKISKRKRKHKCSYLLSLKAPTSEKWSTSSQNVGTNSQSLF